MWELRLARQDALEEIFALYAACVRWMNEVSIHQWNDTDYLSAYPPDDYADMQRRGLLFVLEGENGALLGAVVLLPEDERWNGRPSRRAWYVHNLVTTVKPTSHKKGEKERTCEVCGYTQTKTVSPTGGSGTTDSGKKPTTGTDDRLPFDDVRRGDWFYDDVRTLSGMKVINGYEDGSYKPENAVTRAEFLKLLVTLLCDEMFTPDGAMFKDVPGDEWYSKYIASSIVYGFIDLKDYGETFGPDEPITRREVAKIINKALQVESGKYQTPYADTADPNIVALYGLCLMQGSIDPETGDRLFYPDTEITRAETAPRRRTSCP